MYRHNWAWWRPPPHPLSSLHTCWTSPPLYPSLGTTRPCGPTWDRLTSCGLPSRLPRSHPCFHGWSLSLNTCVSTCSVCRCNLSWSCSSGRSMPVSPPLTAFLPLTPFSVSCPWSSHLSHASHLQVCVCLGSPVYPRSTGAS